MVSTVVNSIFETKTIPITHTDTHTHTISRKEEKLSKMIEKHNIFTNNKITPNVHTLSMNIYQQQQKQNRKIRTFYKYFEKRLFYRPKWISLRRFREDNVNRDVSCFCLWRHKKAQMKITCSGREFGNHINNSICFGPRFHYFIRPNPIFRFCSNSSF